MTSSLKFVFISFCIFTYWSYGSSAQNIICKKLDGCKCVLPDGIGIRLTPLFEEIQWLNATGKNVMFYFHPCSTIPFGDHNNDADCSTGSSICLYNETTKKYENLGTSEEANFLFSDVSEAPIIRYIHANVTTAIQLSCVYRKQSSLSIIEAHSTGVDHQLKLESYWACPAVIPQKIKTVYDSTTRGLSTGSVLVIIFITFTLLYFVCGAIALKLLRGAEGREMIPNYDFWVDLPNLVKDGVMFVLSGCHSSPSYDRI
ncbi:uncharacterized protein [Periplaneta americana]|uniref:uncharacterized protein n=1 Tax=Periplaneta americana TaxID=6978 RepID=UPI0037E7900E